MIETVCTPKRQPTSRLHSTVSQKAVIFILTTVRTWNLTHLFSYRNNKVWLYDMSQFYTGIQHSYLEVITKQIYILNKENPLCDRVFWKMNTRMSERGGNWESEYNDTCFKPKLHVVKCMFEKNNKHITTRVSKLVNDKHESQCLFTACSVETKHSIKFDKLEIIKEICNQYPQLKEVYIGLSGCWV
jgi:hypothetical protein